MSVLALHPVGEGLVNNSSLLDLGDGSALAVDVARDPHSLDEAAANMGLRIRFAADTHLHAGGDRTLGLFTRGHSERDGA